jgi:hypothetical protein
MVGVIVGEQYGIHAINPAGNQLQSEFWRRVDEQSGAQIRLNDGANARPAIARIG